MANSKRSTKHRTAKAVDLRQPRKQPVQERSAATFDAIIQAAEQLLESRRLDEFTTHDVAHRAGVSVGTLYQYFPSKDAIFGLVAHRQSLELYADLAARYGTFQGPLEEAVTALLDAVMDNARHNSAVFQEVVWSATEVLHPEMLRERNRVAAQLLETFLASRSDVRVEDLRLASWMLVELVKATILAAARERPQSLEDGSLRRELTRLVCGYLSGGVGVR